MLYSRFYMLAFQYRFHGHGSLRYVYKNGIAKRSRFFTVKATRNRRRSVSRVAVVISKKVHKSAVGRNRMRRRIYEILRHELPRITRAHDIAIIVSTSEVIALPHEELQVQLQHLLQEAGLYGS